MLVKEKLVHKTNSGQLLDWNMGTVFSSDHLQSIHVYANKRSQKNAGKKKKWVW